MIGRNGGEKKGRQERGRKILGSTEGGKKYETIPIEAQFRDRDRSPERRQTYSSFDPSNFFLL